jgi:serine/threonine protein kinase
MTATKQAKIGDFGIARRLKPGDLATTFIGTSLYISPEIASGTPYDGKTDVWSLGCCVYEMITLRTAVDPLELCVRGQWVIGKMPPADFSSDLTKLTDSMLTIEAIDRPTIAEILATDIMKTTKLRMDASSPAWLAHDHCSSGPEASDVILSHGFAFNEKGQLREINTENPFDYDFTGDRIRNEQRYQELAKSVTEYIHDHLSRKLKMDKIFLPVDAKTDEARCFVFATPDLKSNTKKLLVLIQGIGAPRVGEWARKAIINDCLDAGSQIPWVKQGIHEGYAVLLLNPNANTDKIGGKHVRVRDNDTTTHHVTYVWDNIIKKSPAKQVAIVAHSYGGRNVYDLAVDKLGEFTSRVSAVAFADSSHQTSRQMPPDVVTFLQMKTRHWIASDQPLDTPISGNKNDAPRFSAGDDRHEWTPWSSFKSVFDFFKTQLT